MVTLGSQVRTPSGRDGNVGYIDTDDMIRIDFSDGSSEWCYWWNVTELQTTNEPKHYSQLYDRSQCFNPRYSRDNR